ncbi:MAG: xanthine dehydrogenase molybdopterin binding subunit [Hyphomicrobiaceae bacterium]
MSARTGKAVSRAGAIKGGVSDALMHDSGLKHATGAALYTDDIPEPPGTLKVYIAQSSAAHAEVERLDLTAVRAAQGVVAVLSAADIPGVNDVSPIKGDDPMFATDTVEYVGQAIFAVAAETIEQARAAAAKADVRYKEHPAILTIDEALTAGSYLEPPAVMASGDAAVAIGKAPHQLEGRIRIGGQEHFYLEGQAALAIPGEDGDMLVHASTQHPSEIQHKVASVLGVANHAVTVEVRRMGGGFGGKESQGNLPACVAALAARLTGRPAKCVYDRDDDFMLTGKRHDFRIDYRVGFDEAGRILGVEMEQMVRCGMSFDLSQPIADRAMLHADNCYFLPDIRVTSHRLKTHTQSNTAFRGFGGPQGMLGIERIIDHIAFELGLDPTVVRLRNLYAPRSSPREARKRTPYGMTVEDNVAGEIIEKLKESSGYAQRQAEIRIFNARSPILKRGIALTPVKFGISFTKTFLNQAGALVHLYNDGSIAVNHGGTEMGQGLHTKIAQVVAEEFQVDVARIKITATTTAKVPNTSATAASSGSDMNGMAARNAARAIKSRLTRYLAERFQVEPGEVRFLPGRVEVGQTEIDFDALAGEAHRARISLSATGYYATPKLHWDNDRYTGRPFFYFAYGAAVTEVAIDTLTGENRILRTDILHDVGRSLNPAVDRGQIEGGFVQGAGWLTTEELVWDDKGRLLTHAPSTYKIPASSDRPVELHVALFEGENPEETIYRSKAVGEPPLMLAISVLMALSDAIASVGDGRTYPALDAPATPERILMAVGRMKTARRA